MSYALPDNATPTSGACTTIIETTPADVWVPVGQVVQGLNGTYGVRGKGFHTRTVVLQTNGAAQFTNLMTGLAANEDSITYDGNTYSLEPGGIDVSGIQGTRNTNDVSKQVIVTLKLWRP